MQSIDAKTVAHALGKARRSGSSWMALCPAHDDHDPSLKLDDGPNGLLWNCKVGCEQQAVQEALQARGLLSDTNNAQHGRSRFYLRGLGYPSSVYTYESAEGKALFWVARYSKADGGKDIRPWRLNGSDTVEPGAYPAPRPLYHLPALQRQGNCPVLLVEGEKCVDAATPLLEKHFCVTTWAGGSGAIKHADLTPLAGRRVIIWPDADKPGQVAAMQLARLLASSARSAAVLEVGERPAGWDVADAIAKGWTQDDLRTFIDEHGGGLNPPRGISGYELVRQDMPAPAFLCDPWAPEGLLVLAGRPKLGKTTLLRQKAAAIAEGASFFGEPCAQSPVLFLSLEENDRQMHAKLKAAAFSDVALKGIDFHFRWPRGAAGVAKLHDYFDANPAVRYCVVDSLTRFRDLPTRDLPPFIADYESVCALQSLTKPRPGLLIELVHHARKTLSEDPIDDISGTYGLTAACDGYAVMRRHNEGATLHVGGRQWEREDCDFTLSKADGDWQLDGVAIAGATRKQSAIVEDLRRAGGLTASQLAKLRGVTSQSANEMLKRLEKQGFVYCCGGIYYASDRGPYT
jgi:hypothetical protein